MSRVLVTGGSGFLAGHCIAALLRAGHEVRITLRDRTREAAVCSTLAALEAPPAAAPEFACCDLERDEGWSLAVRDCEYVMHVASPFPRQAPRHADDLIRPAREGTLRVLRAASQARVRRVVITSSVAAISYGHAARKEPFDERDWTNLDSSGLTAYVRSKTLAEQAAWAFVRAHPEAPELSAVNPAAILGPVSGSDFATSIELVQRMLSGGMPLAPRLCFGVVDVRDVAALHLLAMTEPAAAGERFVATAGEPLSLLEIAAVLRRWDGRRAARAPVREAPDWLLRLVGTFSATVGQVVPELGHRKAVSARKAGELLGWAPRSAAEAIAATAESLYRWQLVR